MKKKIIIASISLVVIVLLVLIYNRWCSSTRIAFVNYQAIELARISRANDNGMIKIENLSVEDIDDISKYDMVFVQAMGLKLTGEQREILMKAIKKGTPLLSTMITTPENDFTTINTANADTLRLYLANGGRKNYCNLALFVRKYIDHKIFKAPKPQPVITHAIGLLHHRPKNGDKADDDLQFNSIKQYNNYLKKQGLWHHNAPAIIVMGPMGEPTPLIERLEQTGNNVYPVNDIQRFIEEGHADSIPLRAVINMAHGRVGDNLVAFLQQKNIPLFSPLNVNQPEADWRNDKLGMMGGFLSQSVTMPEIDGALRSMALFAHYKGKDGLAYVDAIPDRLETFVKTVNNYVKLKDIPNSQKRVAIYYYKGPGQNALTAGGMEVAASLYNLLKTLKQQGYNVQGLPASAKALSLLIQQQGAVLGTYAKGAISQFISNGHPALVSKKQYLQWVKQTLVDDKYKEVVKANGEFPGNYLATDNGQLAIPRIQLGNVVLMPQLPVSTEGNSFKIAHGVDAAPSHAFIASYLWMQHAFKANVLVHFGTHGSMEFTPKKQIALSNEDWPDRLVAAIPHLYVYTVGNVGEGMIAKRRSYACLQTYLTQPYMQNDVRNTYKALVDKIEVYNRKVAKQLAGITETALQIKAMVVKLGINRDLQLDANLKHPYTEEQMQQIDNFVEELVTEKIGGKLYTMGVPYDNQSLHTTVMAMCADPIAYACFAVDKQRGRATNNVIKQRSVFTQRYLYPAQKLVSRLLTNPALGNQQMVCSTLGITPTELKKAHDISDALNAPANMMAMMKGMKGMKGKTAKMPKGMMNKKMGMMMGSMPKGMMGMMPKHSKMPHTMGKNAKNTASKKQGMPMAMGDMKMQKPEFTKAEKDFAFAVIEAERTITNVGKYRHLLLESPTIELHSILNAMNGGYTSPSPGGDPVTNPNTLPTGRNMFSINAETTPSEAAWEQGKQLAENTIAMYRKQHHDSIPRKVSFTLWSSEFIETQGASIAQILYLLGVEPVRDFFGRISDVKLIPSKELGRPRIDVVVQTSGQLRDLAASRLFLINRAVEMAAAANDTQYENMVAQGVKETERTLTNKGVSPKEARNMATRRVFGGINGAYGTNIQSMVMSSDQWEKRTDIADTYLNNMGAFYGNDKEWESFKQFAFEAALTRTDVIVQPRQSNLWGALSLDHVYEFMGGLNLAVTKATGKEPDAYISDMRNHYNMRMQDLKESIGIESRTTIFNPSYIKEHIKSGTEGADEFAKTIQNTFGWNVMRTKVIDQQFWNKIYQVYIKDEYQLGLQPYFEQNNPAALQEITAVMLESVRKGMWKANSQQVKTLANLHVDLVNRFNPSGSNFVCNNPKLSQFIAKQATNNTAQQKQYLAKINQIREQAANSKQGMVMKKETLSKEDTSTQNSVNTTVLVVVVIIAIIVVALIVRRNRKMQQK